MNLFFFLFLICSFFRIVQILSESEVSNFVQNPRAFRMKLSILFFFMSSNNSKKATDDDAAYSSATWMSMSSSRKMRRRLLSVSSSESRVDRFRNMHGCTKQYYIVV